MSTPAPPWYLRLARAVGLARAPEAEARSTGPLPITTADERRWQAGADWVAGVASPPLYDPRQALYALTRAPFYAAAIGRLASAAAGRPIVGMVDRADGQTGDIETERRALRAVGLLRAPSSRQTQRQLLEQLAVDFLTSGNAYLLIRRSARGEPASVIRLHPARVDIEPAADGTARAYRYDGAGSYDYYDPADVVHVRSYSVDDGPLGLYGVGLTQLLHPELLADIALAERSRRNGEAGRPAAVLSPKGDPWNASQQRAVEQAARASMRASDGGLMVLSGEADLSPLSWTPQEQALPEQRAFLREQVMAVTGVPPTVMGLEGANFATAQQEARLFWQAVQRLCDTLADALSTLCRQLGDPPGARVAFDFSDIDELQPSRPERVANVAAWVALGADADDAARYEGFADAPELSGPEPSPVAAPAGPPGSASPDAGPAAGGTLSDDDAADLMAQARAVAALLADEEPDVAEVLMEAADLARMVGEALDPEAR